MNCNVAKKKNKFRVDKSKKQCYHAFCRSSCNIFVTNCNKNELDEYNIVIDTQYVTTNTGGNYVF